MKYLFSFFLPFLFSSWGESCSALVLIRTEYIPDQGTGTIILLLKQDNPCTYSWQPLKSFPALKTKCRWGRCSWNSLQAAEDRHQQTQQTRMSSACPSGGRQWGVVRPPFLRLDSSGKTSSTSSVDLHTIKPSVCTNEIATVSFPSRPCSLLFSRITSQINHFHSSPFL